MLSTSNPLLTKFELTFTIMSYYEQTHQSLLLLSKLTKQSRIMLDENYEAFLNSMIANNASIDEEIILKKLNLPSDLFRFTILLWSIRHIKIFIRMKENKHDWIGNYFNSHFIHSRLWIDKLIIKTEWVKMLYPYHELLTTNESRLEIND